MTLLEKYLLVIFIVIVGGFYESPKDSAERGILGLLTIILGLGFIMCGGL